MEEYAEYTFKVYFENFAGKSGDDVFQITTRGTVGASVSVS